MEQRWKDLPSVGIHTSEDFIRKLKGPSDPIPIESTAASSSSAPSAISKIDLAQLAWKQNEKGGDQVKIPRLPQLLLGWILDTLSSAVKPRTKAAAKDVETALSDPHYYSLLSELLSNAQGSLDVARVLSLAPRCNPTTLLSLVIAQLRLPRLNRDQCTSLSARSLARLLSPYATSLASNQGSRASIDELLTVACQVASQSEDSAEGEASVVAVSRLLRTIVSAWIEAGEESHHLSSKSSQNFLDETFVPWCEAVERLSQLSVACTEEQHRTAFSRLRMILLKSGSSTLFNRSTMRELLFSDDGGEFPMLITQIAKAQSNTAVLSALPLLVRSAYAGLKRHSEALIQAAISRQRKGTTTETSMSSSEAWISLQTRLFEKLVEPTLEFLQAGNAANAPVRLALLRAILDRGLATSVSRTESWKRTLLSASNATLAALAAGSLSPHLAAHVDSLHTLWKLDEEIMRPELPTVLDRLLSSRIDSADGSRTVHRAMETLIDDLISSFSRLQEVPVLLQLLDAAMSRSTQPQWTSESIFPARNLSEKISAAVRGYLPATQVVQVLTEQSEALQLVYNLVSAEASLGQKRTRSDGPVDADNVTRACNILRFSQAIVAALPLPAAVSSEAEPILSGLLSTLSQLLSRMISSAAGSMPEASTPRKKRGKTANAMQDIADASPSEDARMLIAATLWYWYGLSSGMLAADIENGDGRLSLSGKVEASLHDAAIMEPLLALQVSSSSYDDASDAVRVECARRLLFHRERAARLGTSAPATKAEDAFWVTLVTYLNTENVAGDGQAILWEMIARRWVSLLNLSAPEGLLPAAAAFMVKSLSPGQSQSRAHAVSLALARNADFHELSRWREAIVEIVLERTGRSGRQAAETLASLSALPVAFFGSDHRDELVRRAIACIASTNQAEDIGDVLQLGIRRWLIEVARPQARFADTIALSIVDTLPFLAAQSSVQGETSQMNLQLLSWWLARLIEQRQLSSAQLQSLQAQLVPHPAALTILAEILVQTASSLLKDVRLDSFHLDRMEPIEVPREASTASAASFVEGLKKRKLALRLLQLQSEDATGLQKGAADVVNELTHLPLDAFIGDLQQTSASQVAIEAVVVEYLDVMTACTSADLTHLGPKVVLQFSSFLAASRSTAVHADAEHSLMRFLGKLSPEQYDSTLSTLLYAMDSLDSADGGRSIDLRSTIVVSGLSLRYGPESTLVITQKQFTRLLNRLQSLVTHTRQNAALLADALQAIENVVAGRAMVLRDVDVGIILAILSDVISPREARRESQRCSSPEIATRIYSLTVQILTSLARLRKDLLLPLLPHLGAVISQLPALFRCPLPQASKTQRKKLLATMPTWLSEAFSRSDNDDYDDDEEAGSSAWLRSGSGLDEWDESSSATYTSRVDISFTGSSPLGPSAARDFSRLLDTLISKTTSSSSSLNAAFPLSAGSSSAPTRIRKRGSKNASKNADSLAKPFSKHAIYVVLGYVHALVPPLSSSQYAAATSYIPGPIKVELQKGLVDLCGVIALVERDWILACGDLAPDEAGKNVFKELWRDWERQRYRGE